MNTKKTMRVIAFILLVAMVILSLGSCGMREETLADKRARFNEEKETLKLKIETTVCATPEEFGDLMLEVRKLVLKANAVFDYSRNPYKTLSGANTEIIGSSNKSETDGECYDINLALRKNESVMTYFKAPYTDKIPDVLYAKGLKACEIAQLYISVAEDSDIEYYAVNGAYPLESYLLCMWTDFGDSTRGKISEDDIAEKLKGVLKNPESLQIHSTKCYMSTESRRRLYVKDNICDVRASDIGCVIVDYSAQNGFGGYTRQNALFYIYSFRAHNGCYAVYLLEANYIGDPTSTGFEYSGSIYVELPDWKVNN